MTKPDPVFYGKPDENIVWLVLVLDDLRGIVTTASCGGHDEPSKIQKPAGHWFVSFEAWHGTLGLKRLIDVLDNIDSIY